MIDTKSILDTGGNPIIPVGYGFKCSSGPAQDANASKPEGCEEDWYFHKGHPVQPCVGLPQATNEVGAAVKMTTITGVPDQVTQKISADCGNNPTKKFDFVITAYQNTEAGKITAAVKHTLTLSGVSIGKNTVSGTLTGTPKIEVFNSEGVNAFSVNIDTVKLQTSS